MIASVSSGRRFSGLAAYLATGRSGQETERVAWSEARNLSTNEPILAGKIMQAEAARATQVEKPVYHIALAFDPHDAVNRDVMRRAVDRLLADLGLSEHQAVIVAHQDRVHPHVHIMVNRVHPETGIAWDRSFDYRRIEESLRAQERELGVRVVQGKHAAIPGWERDRDQGTSTPPAGGERRKGEEAQRRRGDAPFVDRVRADLAALRAAGSWAALHDALAERGLRLERKGQGLVIVGRDVPAAAATDGRNADREVKASRVHRDLALRSLERRFGAVYEPAARERAGQRAPTADPTRTPESAADRVPRRSWNVRIDAPLFRVAARAAAPDVRESQSWGELAERLARRGLRLDRTGYGLAVTDGVARVRFSDVGPAARVRALETRFGQTYGEWARAHRRADLDLPTPRQGARGADVVVPGAERARPAGRPLSPSARYVGAQLGRYDRLRRLDRLVRQIGEDASRVASARQVLSGREAAAIRADGDLRGAFGRVYQDAGAALTTFRATADRSGVAAAAAALRRAPEQLGALRGAPARVPEGESRGLAGRLAQAFRRDKGDPAALDEARAAAANVARVAETWGAAQRQRPVPSELAGLARWEHRLRTRERNVRAEYAALPSEPTVARAIARALPRLSREEFDRMVASLRPSQAGLLRTFEHTREAVGDALREVRRGRAPDAGDRSKRGEYEARDLTARAVRAALREMLPEEMRQIQRAVQAVHSPMTALRQAIGQAVRREVLGHEGPER